MRFDSKIEHNVVKNFTIITAVKVRLTSQN